MKKYFILIAFSIGLVFSANAQSKSYKMYDAFADESGISNFSFSKNMLDAIDLDLGDEDDGDERKVTGDLNKVTFMSYNPRKGDLSGPEFIKKAISYLPKSSYHKYIDPDGDDDDAEIWLMGKKKKYKECHVFFKNDNRNSIHFVVSFYGDFRVTDMDEIRKLGREFSD